MDKFITLLLGKNDFPTYAAYFIFALIGAIISLYIKTLSRDKSNVKTPYIFSWTFLVQDNLLRLLNGFLLAFIAFRFSTEFIGTEITMWMAVIIGASSDRLAGLFDNLQQNARK